MKTKQTSERRFAVAAEAFAVLRDMAAFDRLGGADSFFGRQHVFEYLLKDEHAKAGETDQRKGAYRYKGMECYGNIVSYAPSLEAAKRFVDEMGYTIENLVELRDWYQGRGKQGSIDAVTLGIYLKQFLSKRLGQ